MDVEQITVMAIGVCSLAAAGWVCLTLLRRLWCCHFAALDPWRFTCHVEERIDETCPQGEDRFLCVYMTGRIPTAKAAVDTEVRVELLDITDGASHTEPVLSASPQWRREHSPAFYYQAYNGLIPHKNAILAKEVVIAKIPFHLLRFARRGRRTIRVSAAVLARHDGQVIVGAADRIDYVTCCEGFCELQERREGVLGACVEMACAVAFGEPAMPSVGEVIDLWIKEKTRHFTPRSNVAEPLDRLEASSPKGIDAETACERLLTLGQKADHLAAIDLSLQVAALYPALSGRQEELLWSLAERFSIAQEPFLALCQKRLLTPNGSLERWRLLLGVRHDLSPEILRKRLNEEYRKWNARVTHPDVQIRRQADALLSLIAEVRSRTLFAIESV